jgi:hypothetical protein
MATEELDSFDCTLANLSEIVFSCIEAAGAKSVAEIGAENGLFTQELLAWAARTNAERVTAIDPAPRKLLRSLADDHPELELIVATSHDALPSLELPDVVIIDGDHNYFTVREELRLIGERAPGSELPMLLLHDIGWPLARRDSYHDPEQIPVEHRQPLARDAYLVPGEAGIAERGLYYECTAAAEGGERNGVLTAVDDFVAERPELKLAIVAPFFGLGVVWHRDAPWAAALEAALAPWDRNPFLERVERKRLDHLVAEFQTLQRIDALHTADYVHRYRLIGRLLPYVDSAAIGLAERISAIRQRGRPNVSRANLAALLEELAAGDIDVEELRRHPERSPEEYAIRVSEEEVSAASARADAPRPAPGDLVNESP